MTVGNPSLPQEDRSLLPLVTSARPLRFDDTLLKQLRQREPASHKLAHDYLFPRILRVCRKMLKNETTAEQTAADIWIDFVLRYVHNLKSGASIPSYLRMMTVRRCMRAREFVAKHDSLDVVPELKSKATNPETDIDRQRQLSQLQRCIRQLDQRERDLLLMYFGHDMTQQAIGDLIGVSKQHIGRILRKAEGKLKICLEKANQ